VWSKLKTSSHCLFHVIWTDLDHITSCTLDRLTCLLGCVQRSNVTWPLQTYDRCFQGCRSYAQFYVIIYIIALCYWHKSSSDGMARMVLDVLVLPPPTKKLNLWFCPSVHIAQLIQLHWTGWQTLSSSVEMRWDEMRWDEMRWDEMRWDEMRWDEMIVSCNVSHVTVCLLKSESVGFRICQKLLDSDNIWTRTSTHPHL